MYWVATFLVRHFWRNPSEDVDIADSLGVLVLTWNAGFYRYGSLNFDSLKDCIENNLEAIEGFKKRDIKTLNESDEPVVKELFNAFLLALRITKHKSGEVARSPVSVAKALQVLWDAEQLIQMAQQSPHVPSWSAQQPSLLIMAYSPVR